MACLADALRCVSQAAPARPHDERTLRDTRTRHQTLARGSVCHVAIRWHVPRHQRDALRQRDRGEPAKAAQQPRL